MITESSFLDDSLPSYFAFSNHYYYSLTHLFNHRYSSCVATIKAVSRWLSCSNSCSFASIVGRLKLIGKQHMADPFYLNLKLVEAEWKP